LRTGYVALIKRVQADHPRAKLFLASGVGDSDPQSQVQKVAAYVMRVSVVMNLWFLQTAKLVGATYISLSGLVGSDLGSARQALLHLEWTEPNTNYPAALLRRRCDYHPTTKADQRLGDKIASIVGPAMGWN